MQASSLFLKIKSLSESGFDLRVYSVHFVCHYMVILFGFFLTFWGLCGVFSLPHSMPTHFLVSLNFAIILLKLGTTCPEPMGPRCQDLWDAVVEVSVGLLTIQALHFPTERDPVYRWSTSPGCKGSSTLISCLLLIYE